VKDTASVGRIGEHIASAAIESLGWRVTLAPTDAIDLIAMRDGRIMRVQVKASNLCAGAGRTPRLQFLLLPPSHAELPKCIDIFAYVDLQQRRARFARPCGRRKVTLYPRDFGPDIEVETWAQVCAELYGDGSG
jgi:hypothetical protein